MIFLDILKGKQGGKLNILLLGAPGSGKSTIGQRLAGEMRWEWVSSGEILRQSSEEWVQEKLKTAQLFDDEMVAGLVLARLNTAQNAILDGFPRDLRQAEILKERGVKLDVVVEVNVPVEEIVQRLALRGRAQDTPEVIQERVKMYEETKAEILAYLVGNGAKLAVVDGVGTPDEVYMRVKQTLGVGAGEK